MSQGFYSLESILDKALEGQEFSNEPAPLTEKEKAKQEKWLAKQKEKEEQAARLQKEMAAHREEQRKKAAEQIKATTKPVAETTPGIPPFERAVNALINCRDREERAALEEALLMCIEEFVETLKDPSWCFPTDQLDIEPERFVRSFSDRKRFLFCHGRPIRPSFFLQDKDSQPKVFHPAWSLVNADTLSFEFGKKIPMRRLPNGDREPVGTEAKPYFSVQYWNEEANGFRNVMLAYERVPDEFSRLRCKLEEFFSGIISESRKKFDDLRIALENRAPGLFSREGRTSEGVKHVLNDFLRAGGDGSVIVEQSVPANMVVVFNPNCRYILVNTSHRKSTIVDPERAIEEKVSGFAKSADGKISTHLPRQMALIEIDGPNMTVVRSA